MGQLFSRMDPQGPMLQVREGMAVYDRADKRIGTVEGVHLGDGTELAQDVGVAPATPGHTPQGRDSIIDDIAEALAVPDDLPETARARLQRVGYIAIDATGIFTGKRFATTDQVAEVGQDRVILNVADDELIRR